MGEPVREEWITAAAAGKSFAEVGGLWGTVNEQVTVAAGGGATETTMIDVAPEDGTDTDLWRLFRDRLAEHDVQGTACVQASIDDPGTPERVGSFDVVHCSGVLYHCPEPLYTLCQLRAITRETLVLGTATMPETVSSTAGSVNVEPGSALFVPAMSASQRAVMGHWLREIGAHQALGVNYPMASNWAMDDYGAWWWFFTRDYVSALLRVAGFTVLNISSYWEGRAALFLAGVAGPARQ